MKKRSKTWKTGALLLLCIALAACSKGNENPAASGEAASSDTAAVTSDGKKVVTMTVMTKDRFLTEAEQKFEAANPDIDIQIKEIVPADTSGGDKMVIRKGPGDESGPKPEDVDKYVNSVNTAIMSGNASDIIAVENLPVDVYVDKGLLADWDELAGKDNSFNKSDYYENILNGVSQGKGWYGIPAYFSLDVMLGDAALLKKNGLDETTWTWDQFADLLEKTKTDGKYGISMMSPEKLLSFLTESVYGQLVKKDGKSLAFDADAFKAYMEKIKKLYDSGLATAEGRGPDTASFIRMNMSMPEDSILMPKMSSGESKAMLRPPGTGQDEGIPFKSNEVLGLNANSKAKEAAWSFVKFLLSEEMQASKSLMNFPVNKAALRTKLANMQEMLMNSGSGGGTGGPKIMIKGKDGEEVHPTVTDEDIDKLVNLMPSVGVYGNHDPKVLSMIAEESAAYFTGNKSADAVTKSLANRINTYLNE